MGVFSEFQPLYAEHGLATFPVGPDKRPAVKGYAKIGLKASNELRLKYPNSPALGFICGRRSGITILDIDSPDQRRLSNALDRHGPSPFIVRTPSGGHHVYYRYAGEPRCIRPNIGQPVDILGSGLGIAAPSQSAKGSYKAVQGGFDDLGRLPVIRGLESLPAARYEDGKGIGKRNDALWRFAMMHAPHCDNLDQLLDVVKHNNERFTPELPADEVMKVATSAWGYQERGENWIGRTGARAVSVTHDLIDRFVLFPDALALLVTLRRHHWGREFVLANGMAERFGWGLARFRKARAKLVECDQIACVHKGGKGPNDPPRYLLR